MRWALRKAALCMLKAGQKLQAICLGHTKSSCCVMLWAQCVVEQRRCSSGCSSMPNPLEYCSGTEQRQCRHHLQLTVTSHLHVCCRSNATLHTPGRRACPSPFGSEKPCFDPTCTFYLQQ